MLLAGIVCHDCVCKTANLINSIFSSVGKKVSIIDSKSIVDMDLLRIRNYISELEKNNTEILLLKILISDVKKEVFNYLKFDIMIYTDIADDLREIKIEDYKELMGRVFELLDEKGIAIVNVDDNELIQFLQGMRYYIFTYGFNSKASMTTSSIGDTVFKENFICCLQRSISTKNGLIVEPQEYRVRMSFNELNAYHVLAAAAFAVVNGVDLNQVN